MKVLHISPTYFSDLSLIGGGERYAYELARTLALKEHVVFLSFSDQPKSFRDGCLQVELIRKSSFLNSCFIHTFAFILSIIKWIKWADVVHCHQVHMVTTDISVILGKILQKKIFVTDLGGGQRYTMSYHLPILRRTNAFLLISNYSKQRWELRSKRVRPETLITIYGGVDTKRFSPVDENKTKRSLFVGRLLPHKGVDCLIDAIDNPLSLDIIGRVYSKDYYDLLKMKSNNRDITFYTRADDDFLVSKYRTSLVTILPSVYQDCYNNKTVIPELLGLVVLESMACGTPVIVTSVASLPEIVHDGVTGFIVPPNDSTAIQRRIRYLYENPEKAKVMGDEGRKRVLKYFTWDAVSKLCLNAYTRL